MMDHHPLEDLARRYLSQKDIARSTRKSYRIVFKAYITYLKDNHIAYAKTGDVIRYRESKRRSGYSSHTIHIHISALKGFYRYLWQNQKRLGLPVQYAHDIMAPIKNERINHRIKKPVLTIEQAKHLILHTKNNRKHLWHYRDHAIIYLMMTSGLRSIEIVHAKRKDYKQVDGKQVLYVRRKGRKSADGFVKIAPGVKEAIDQYLDKRKDDHPYLFISHKKMSKEGYLSRTFFKDMFPRVLKECGLEDLGLTPHCLRHTAAVMNLRRGGSLEQTRQLMRHVHVHSTLVYVHHLERMKDDSENQIEQFILKEASFVRDHGYIILE